MILAEWLIIIAAAVFPELIFTNITLQSFLAYIYIFFFFSACCLDCELMVLTRVRYQPLAICESAVLSGLLLSNVENSIDLAGEER